MKIGGINRWVRSETKPGKLCLAHLLVIPTLSRLSLTASFQLTGRANESDLKNLGLFSVMERFMLVSFLLFPTLNHDDSNSSSEADFKERRKKSYSGGWESNPRPRRQKVTVLTLMLPPKAKIVICIILELFESLDQGF